MSISIAAPLPRCIFATDLVDWSHMARHSSGRFGLGSQWCRRRTSSERGDLSKLEGLLLPIAYLSSCGMGTLRASRLVVINGVGEPTSTSNPIVTAILRNVSPTPWPFLASVRLAFWIPWSLPWLATRPYDLESLLRRLLFILDLRISTE